MISVSAFKDVKLQIFITSNHMFDAVYCRSVCPHSGEVDSVKVAGLIPSVSIIQVKERLRDGGGTSEGRVCLCVCTSILVRTSLNCRVWG